ncbi:7099_t:CDS:1, partial [Ambispora gerdemannii]
LSLEEALSCILPPITYSLDATSSTSSTETHGSLPKKVLLWEGFFDEVNRFRFDQQPKFERPKFNDEFNDVTNEEHVRIAVYVNICQVLNKLMGPHYKYSQRNTFAPGVPDFNAFYQAILILVIEIKRKHILKINNRQKFPDFYNNNKKAKTVIRQIYKYMTGNQLQYGILATYDSHWFIRRSDETPEVLYISETLSWQSTSPPVLKAYAYIALQAKDNLHSHNPLIIQMMNEKQYNYSFRPLSSSQSSSPENQPIIESQNFNNFNFADFEFKDILGVGQTGKTLRCKFHGELIALKSIDLYKNAIFLNKMLKEIEIYKDLADIQGKYIPKLVCYGYYEGGMSFVIGMTIVGTALSHHNITKQQKSKALEALKAIHEHGILHNDIREENILVNDNGDMCVIDFGMASRTDLKKKRKLFRREQLELSRLLNLYIM